VQRVSCRRIPLPSLSGATRAASQAVDPEEGMKAPSRVIWSEGMHLAQQHFQAQADYFEGSSVFAVSSLFDAPYGLLACELQPEALLNGTVTVLHARGIMPDGLAFHFPEDPTPEPLEIRELFSPTRESHLVLLAIPAHRTGRANVALDGEQGDFRFTSITREIADETTGLDSKPLRLARKNFRLMLDMETDDADAGLVTMPIARVRRDGSGNFVYDPEYVPPCLQVGASPRLLQILERLTEVMAAKAEALRGERAAAGSVSAYSASEVASFWLSHAIHSGLPTLRHHAQVRSSHPARVYPDLARIAGALCTFSTETDAAALPTYEHDRPGECFAALDRHIRQSLDLILPTKAVRFALEKKDEYHTAAVKDSRCFGRAHWFLGVRAGLTGAEIAERVPKLGKVCSAKHIVPLVQRAHSGLALEHVARPPAAITPRVGTQYFSIRIDTEHPCWKTIVSTKGVGVYIPDSVPGAELEVAVVIES
jgi:type VI secretion system protein ImpJ